MWRVVLQKKNKKNKIRKEKMFFIIFTNIEIYISAIMLIIKDVQPEKG